MIWIEIQMWSRQLRKHQIRPRIGTAVYSRIEPARDALPHTGSLAGSLETEVCRQTMRRTITLVRYSS